MSQLRSRYWARLGAALILCLAAHPAEAAPAKAKGSAKGKKAPKTSSSPLSNALNEKGGQIQQCAIDHALEKGAKKVDVNVRVTINKQGSVVDTKLDVNVEGGDGAKVKACIDGVVRTAKFPPVSTPLATAERRWTMAAQ